MRKRLHLQSASDLLETGSAVSLQVLLRLAEEGLRRFAPCAHETLLIT